MKPLSTLIGGFILYSCRNLTLLQKCNVVLNYAETFYKSNVNCTFFLYKNKSKKRQPFGGCFFFIYLKEWMNWCHGTSAWKTSVPAVRPADIPPQLYGHEGLLYVQRTRDALQRRAAQQSVLIRPALCDPVMAGNAPSSGATATCKAHGCVAAYLGHTGCTFPFLTCHVK